MLLAALLLSDAEDESLTTEDGGDTDLKTKTLLEEILKAAKK